MFGWRMAHVVTQPSALTQLKQSPRAAICMLNNERVINITSAFFETMKIEELAR